jgi:hypothetical protein
VILCGLLTPQLFHFFGWVCVSRLLLQSLSFTRYTSCIPACVVDWNASHLFLMATVIRCTKIAYQFHCEYVHCFSQERI